MEMTDSTNNSEIYFQEMDSEKKNEVAACFICDGKFICMHKKIISTFTSYSNKSLIDVLSGLVGSEFIIVVNDDDRICDNCFSLFNKMDKLENDLGSVKLVLSRYLNYKYGIFDEEREIDSREMVFINGHSVKSYGNPVHVFSATQLPEKCLKPKVINRKKKLYCSICDIWMPNINSFNRHITRRHIVKEKSLNENNTVNNAFFCRFCNSSFTSVRLCKDHIKINHFDVNVSSYETKGNPKKCMKIVKSDFDLPKNFESDSGCKKPFSDSDVVVDSLDPNNEISLGNCNLLKSDQSKNNESDYCSDGLKGLGITNDTMKNFNESCDKFCGFSSHDLVDSKKNPKVCLVVNENENNACGDNICLSDMNKQILKSGFFSNKTICVCEKCDKKVKKPCKYFSDEVSANNFNDISDVIDSSNEVIADKAKCILNSELNQGIANQTNESLISSINLSEHIYQDFSSCKINNESSSQKLSLLKSSSVIKIPGNLDNFLSSDNNYDEQNNLKFIKSSSSNNNNSLLGDGNSEENQTEQSVLCKNSRKNNETYKDSSGLLKNNEVTFDENFDCQTKINDSNVGNNQTDLLINDIKLSISRKNIENLTVSTEVKSSINERNISVNIISHPQICTVSSPSDLITNNCKFVCNLCGSNFFTELSYKNHCLIHSNDKNKKYANCFVCNDTFLSIPLVYSHIMEKHPNWFGYHCFVCNIGYNERDSVEFLKHSKDVHLSEKMCTYCGKIFKTDSQYLNHAEFFHRKNKNCSKCNKVFFDIKKLKTHERNHKKCNYTCNICNKLLKTRSGLKLHKLLHSGQYPFICEFCGNCFISAHALNEHKSKHLKEPRYICDVCGKKFQLYDTYHKHRNHHDNPFPKQCDICKQYFRSASRVAEHKRKKHTFERPYKCPHCPSSFCVSNLLKYHLYNHTKQYPYTCEICNKGFPTRNKHRIHMLKKHKDDSFINNRLPNSNEHKEEWFKLNQNNV